MNEKSGMTISTPGASSSGNPMPASMMMASPPHRIAIMFMPNTPTPPRGIISSLLSDIAWQLELDELLWVVRQIEFLFFGNQTNAPLLHRQRPEQYLDWLAVIVLSYLVDHHCVSRDWQAFQFPFKQCGLGRFPDLPTERRAERLGEVRRDQHRSNVGNYVGVTSATIKERPAFPPLNVDHLTYATHIDILLTCAL